ncbi:MFS transporter [Brevibacterium sp. CCUG 69071]|uniref:MFS transporter n=1 Tax=Brevibacterium sp. CCUG 69071 TaxID=2052937 RepID=UPI001E28DAD1|nr:MFS transporter [Brevibacterium sp. CCUG 69071]
MSKSNTIPTTARGKERLTREQAKAVGAALLGWTIDMFDLMIILHVASYVSVVFFPSDNDMLSLTATYASFAISLLVRPLGALLLGALADRRGRKLSMIIGVVGAGIATALMGILPGAALIGVAAPILFIALRIVQGLFVGGIAASTHTLATESVPERFRGMTAGLIKGGGASLAVVIINLMVIGISAVIGPEGFASWGWRILFLAALLGALINYVVVRRTEESPLWEASRRAETAADAPTVPKTPIRGLFSRQWRGRMLLTAAIVFSASAPYYLTTGILPTVFKSHFHLPQDQASLFVIINVLGSAMVAVLCGHISQHVGRKPVFIWSGIGCLILIPGLYWTLDNVLADQPASILVASAVMVMISGAISAPLIIFLNETFPTHIRSTATAFSWNVGYGLSGMMPTVVTAVSAETGNIITVLIVLSTAISAVFLMLMFTSGETKGRLQDAAYGMNR